MKSYLEFDMADPGDREQHEDMLKAQDLFSAVRDFDNWMRSCLKTDQEKDVQQCRDRLHSILVGYGVELW